MIPILHAYLDESSDEKRKDAFCVGALLTSEQQRAKIQDLWLERLKTPDAIAYFRATSCKGVHGPFFELRNKYGPHARTVADRIRADLETILLSHHWRGFGIGIVMPDYRKMWNAIPVARRFYQEDPTEAAYSAVFYEIARAARKHAPRHQVAYIIDDSTYSEKLGYAFEAVKINHPVLAKSMATLAPLDDKITPPLQMADLIASIVKDVFLEWLQNGKARHAPLEARWHNHFELIGKWDEDYMLRNIRNTLSNKKFKNGLLAMRATPGLTPRDLKRERKRRRRFLVKQLQRG